MFFGTVKGSYTGAANTTGLFEQARNGTLFLDEINSMDISLQAKLLKVIENKTVRRIGDMKEREIRCPYSLCLKRSPPGMYRERKAAPGPVLPPVLLYSVYTTPAGTKK